MNATPQHRQIQVLIVDGSAVARQVLASILAREPDMDVSTAPDPVIALARMKHKRQHVVVCDLKFARMDGLLFVREVKKLDVAVVICAQVDAAADLAMKALENGAVDVVERPAGGVRDFLFESAPSLPGVVRAAGAARRARDVSRPEATSAAVIAPLQVKPGVVIGIGASTGGTDAIRWILENLPAQVPPLIIVQHMPKGFTKAFANRLNELSKLEVAEARGGESLKPGTALIAPGDRHLLVRKSGFGFVTELWAGPRVRGHRPSVDVLFESLSEVVREKGVGVILTGMGNDGSEGLARMREAGAMTIAQDEKSSVVFGMPKSAIQRGSVEVVASLSRIPGLLVSHGSGQRVSGRRLVC